VANPDGVVAPGSGYNMPQDLEIIGGYTQGPGGPPASHYCGIPGTPDSWQWQALYRRLVRTTLDGFLDVHAERHMCPTATDSFEVVHAGGGVSGRFANTPGDILRPAGSGTFDVQYYASSVILTNYRPLACVSRPTADLNGDAESRCLTWLFWRPVAGRWPPIKAPDEVRDR